MTNSTQDRSAFWRFLPAVFLAAAALAFLALAPVTQSKEGAKDPDRPQLTPQGEAYYRSEGYSTFQDYCTLCHGADGTGGGSAAKFLKSPPKDLTQIAASRGGKYPFGEVFEIIDGREGAGHGGREMPIWGRLLSDLEPGQERDEAITRKIQELVFYLESIQKPAKEKME